MKPEGAMSPTNRARLTTSMGEFGRMLEIKIVKSRTFRAILTL